MSHKNYPKFVTIGKILTEIDKVYAEIKRLELKKEKLYELLRLHNPNVLVKLRDDEESK